MESATENGIEGEAFGNDLDWYSSGEQGSNESEDDVEEKGVHEE